MLKVGDKVDRYTLEAMLGEGGMGSVYRAHDERLERHVALKVVRAGKDEDDADRQEATARLVREARAAAKLDHPNAVSIFDVGSVDGTAFIAMELVSGRTLRMLIADTAHPVEARVRWLADVARALAAAHRAGIVHRDVKPENVMVRSDGMVKVLDFGIARRSSREVDPSAPTEAGALLTLTAAGVPVGTPLYMAPEQIKGDPVDGRTDQFAWGVLAYETLTGRVPWDSKNDALALAAAILTQTPAPLTNAPPDFARAVERALSKSPSDRFDSMQDLLASFEGGAAPASVMAPLTVRTSSKPPEAAVPSPRAMAQPSPAPAMQLSANSFRRYSTETLRAIVERALERQADQPLYAQDEVIAAAREVGVDDETLRAAARDVAERQSGAAIVTAARGRMRVGLLRHVGIYACVNLFIVVTAGWHAAQWVMASWGLWLAISALGYFFPDEEKLKKNEDKRRRKEARLRLRGVDEREVESAADVLLSSTAARVERLRIAHAGPPLRVGDPRHEAEREAEAQVEQENVPREVRR